jgi:hypothetical protein
MQPLGTVVAFGAAATADAARLDAAAYACDVMPSGEDLFVHIKRAEAGSMLLLLADESDDPALAAAAKAARILERRGGGEAVLVLPAVPALPGPQARSRLERAASLTGCCAVQPVAPACWVDAVRCFVEPLAVYGLVGVDPREIHGLLRPRAALLHLWQDDSLDRALRDAREVLVTCRLRPSAALREVEEAARRVRKSTEARLVLAGPEVSRDEGPRAIAAVFL